MKKLLIYSAFVLAILAIFFVRIYKSSPGFVSAEMYQEFEKTKPTCYGIDILLNREATYADAPGKSLCIGFLR